MKTRSLLHFLTSFTLLVTISFLSTVPSAHSSPALNVTVFTDKQSYYHGELVNIYGNLTENGNLTVGLVALEVRDPLGEIYIARTLPTGPDPMVYGYISILSVVPCDEWGNLKYSFGKGTNAYFKVRVRNTAGYPQTVGLITLNVFDVKGCSLGVLAYRGIYIAGSTTDEHIFCYYIQDNAFSGTATVYANAYTDWPSLNGSAYFSERNASFEITGSGGGAAGTVATSTTDGTYSLTFRLPLYARVGYYTIHVSARYHLQQSPTESTIFRLVLIADINGDGAVDSTDDGIFGIAWGSSIGQPYYNPNCDFNKDGVIDSTDDGIFGIYWGRVA